MPDYYTELEKPVDIILYKSDFHNVTVVWATILENLKVNADAEEIDIVVTKVHAN